MSDASQPTVYYLAAAILAFEENGGQCHAWTGPGYTANKVLIREYIFNAAYQQHLDNRINDAEEISNYLKQKILLLTLAGKKTGFLEEVVFVLNKSHCSLNNIPTIVWAPKLYHDFKMVDEFYEKLADYKNSQYVGSVKDKIIFTATVLHSSFIKKLEAWSVTVADGENNLYSFLTKELSKVKSGQLKARVRSHDLCKYHNNFRVTKLNYVRFLGENNDHSK